MFLCIGWFASGCYFVLIVDANRHPWPMFHVYVWLALQMLATVCSAIGRTRYRAWYEPRDESPPTGGAADPRDATRAAPYSR